jgi:hypothetical protein
VTHGGVGRGRREVHLGEFAAVVCSGSECFH